LLLLFLRVISLLVSLVTSMADSNLIVDLSNLTHVIRHSKFKKGKMEFDQDALVFYVLQTICNIAARKKAGGVMIACDSGDVWRRDVLPSYKRNREGNRDEFYEQTKQAILILELFLRDYTDMTVLQVNRAEADDIIAIACQLNAYHNTILSTDRDFIQLINHNTTLFDIVSGKNRTTEDRNYDLFVKLIRGDTGDGVPSAMPNVRETRLKLAYEDKTEFVNLMESTNKFGNKVKDDFKRNNTLINLIQQPTEIIQSITKELHTYNQENYGFVRTSAMLGKMGFGEVIKDLNTDTMKLPYLFINRYK